MVSPETIADALKLVDPAEAAERLIAMALRSGGPDNVTCVVADIVTTPMGSSEPIVAGAAAHDRGRTDSATADSAAGRAALARSAAAAGAVDDEPNDTNLTDTAAAGAGVTDTDESSDSKSIVDGASANNGDATPGDPKPKPTEGSRARQQRLVRSCVLVAVIVLIVLGFGYGGWNYTQRQYYVGPMGPAGDGDDRRIAIHRGVSGSILGIEFSSVLERTNLRLKDLPQVQRRDVANLVTADSQAQAREIIDRLDDQLLPPCNALREVNRSPAPTPSPGETTAAENETLVPDAKPSVNCRETGDGLQATP
ncbi:MAG: hypothetical protein ACRDPW_02565 [Mycobacteriales bacterium]